MNTVINTFYDAGEHIPVKDASLVNIYTRSNMTEVFPATG